MQKGFTLIELLVVIAIVAILAVVVVLTINPAEMMKQARDSNRISDLGTLQSAISLYLSDYASPDLTYRGTESDCFASALSTTCAGRYSGGNSSSTTSRAVDGTGWIPVKLTDVSSGSPLGNLPTDPTNNTTYYYAYKASSTLVFELTAELESTRYASGGGQDKEGNDGGNSSTLYEVGTAPGLAL